MDLLTTVAKAPCPDCGLTVKLGPKPKEGRQLTCINCGAYLEIINLKPLELDWAFSDFEPDWDPDEKEWDEEDSNEEERTRRYGTREPAQSYQHDLIDTVDADQTCIAQTSDACSGMTGAD